MLVGIQQEQPAGTSPASALQPPPHAPSAGRVHCDSLRREAMGRAVLQRGGGGGEGGAGEGGLSQVLWL